MTALEMEYQLFVNGVLKKYKVRISKLKYLPDGETYFEIYWKMFFDEILIKLNELCGENRTRFEDWKIVRAELQKIAEEGLNEFKYFAEEHYNFVRKIKVL